jgi:glucose dehydrogenase
VNRGLVWTAFVLFALCLIGTVAWPLWSDSDLWGLGFGALAVLILFPVVLWPPIRADIEAFNMKEPPSGGTHTS